ncbi:unnamed protein product, partial [marine sediment metagenome]
NSFVEFRLIVQKSELLDSGVERPNTLDREGEG